MQQGFTLLELLIVIAIIGLLASVILVSYNGYTDKARLANALQWASGLSHSLFYEAVGVWSFNEGSGQTAQDESGQGNNGTLGSTGGSDVNDPIWRCANTSSGYTPSGEGCSLEFDGVNDYVDVGDKDFDYSEFTVAVWAKSPTNNPAQVGFPIHVTNLVGKGNWNQTNEWYIGYKSSGVDPATHLSFVYGITWGAGPSYSVNNFDLSQWHYIVGVATGNKQVLYLDGKQVATKDTTHGSVANDYNLQIARSSYTGRYFNGLIDDVRIFSEAFTQTQIQQLYTDGLPAHQPLAQQ